MNLGLDTRSGLVAPEPKLPRKADPLWTLASVQDAQPKTQRTVT